MNNPYQNHFKKMKSSTKGNKAKTKFPVKKSEAKSPMVRPKRRPRKALKMNWPLIILLMLSTIVSAGFVQYPDLFDKTVKSVKLRFGPIAMAAEEAVKGNEGKEENSARAKAENGEKTADPESEEKTVDTSQIRNWTDEELSHFSKLNERKDQLDLREQQLAKLEEELHKQKIEIEARIRRLEELRGQISKVLKDRVNMDQDKVAKLVDFYSNMKPQQAAKVFESINEDLAVEILGQMKKQNAASIMNLLKPDKAQTLSEKFAGYKR